MRRHLIAMTAVSIALGGCAINEATPSPPGPLRTRFEPASADSPAPDVGIPAPVDASNADAERQAILALLPAPGTPAQLIDITPADAGIVGAASVGTAPLDDRLVVTWGPANPLLSDFILDPATMTIESLYGTTPAPLQVIYTDAQSFTGAYRGWTWKRAEPALEPGDAGTVDSISITLAQLSDTDQVLLTIVGTRLDANGLGENISAGFLYTDPTT